MTPTLQELGIDLDRLSIEDKLAVADQLWDSVVVAMENEAPTPTQRAELERRIARADADPKRGVPWETVLADARARWQQ